MDSSESAIVMEKGDLICRPVGWVDIVKFLVFNYLLHTLTVLSKPGQGIFLSTITRLAAFFVPSLGTVKAVETIYRFARGEKTPLKVALRARALCMIEDLNSIMISNSMAEDWAGDPALISEPTTRERPANPVTISVAVTTVQGQHPIQNEGTWTWVKNRRSAYSSSFEPCLVLVPLHFTVEPLISDGPDKFDISCNYNIVRILAAIAQIVYGSFQIYQASGPQLEKFGYAAYQLTIIPYIMMSLINLLASLCEPEYPTMFLVSRSTDEEGEVKRISGEVGKVAPAPAESLHRIRMRGSPGMEICLVGGCLTVLACAIIAPYVIIWYLTGFRLGFDPGTSAAPETSPANIFWGFSHITNEWVILWIIFGQVSATLGLVGHPKYDIFSYGGRMAVRIGAGSWFIAATCFSVTGFRAAIRLMMDDKVCIVI